MIIIKEQHFKNIFFTGQEIFSEDIFANDGQNVSGDSSERQTPQAVCAEINNSIYINIYFVS